MLLACAHSVCAQRSIIMQIHHPERYAINVILAAFAIALTFSSHYSFTYQIVTRGDMVLVLLIGTFFALLSLCCFWGIAAINFSSGLRGPQMRRGETGTVVAIYDHPYVSEKRPQDKKVVVRVFWKSADDSLNSKDVFLESWNFEKDVYEAFPAKIFVGSHIIMLADGHLALFDHNPTLPQPTA